MLVGDEVPNRSQNLHRLVRNPIVNVSGLVKLGAQLFDGAVGVACPNHVSRDHSSENSCHIVGIAEADHSWLGRVDPHVREYRRVLSVHLLLQFAPRTTLGEGVLGGVREIAGLDDEFLGAAHA